eukprot:1533863-Alexandrium_andersonii.AAC.1
MLGLAQAWPPPAAGQRRGLAGWAAALRDKPQAQGEHAAARCHDSLPALPVLPALPQPLGEP